MNSYLHSAVTNSVSNAHSHTHPWTAGAYSSANLTAANNKQHQFPQSVHAAAPVTEFNLSEVGVDVDRLISDISASFEKLSLDVYEKRRQQIELLKKLCPDQIEKINAFFFDYMCSKSSLNDISEIVQLLSSTQLIQLENVGAVRNRSIAKFEISFTNSPSPIIKRVAANGFVQKTSLNTDFRSLPRFFEEASDEVTDNIEVRQILRYVASKVKTQHHEPLHHLVLTLHQVIVTVNADTPFVLPDGVHQDGADYIVSAIPLIMSGVVTPLSTVYNSQLQSILETRLAIGQGLLHDDRSYWHSVSTLFSTGSVGRRGTFGLDVQLS